MPQTNQPQPSYGRFNWNAGGWFGGAVGCTAWMLACGTILVYNGELAVAAVLFVCFLITNLIAVFVWTRRESVAPFWGLMIWFYARNRSIAKE